jgi:hypothetical protein
MLNLAMAIAYLTVGTFLVLSPSADRIIPSEYVTTIAVVISLYGIFRLYRAYNQLSKGNLQ